MVVKVEPLPTAMIKPSGDINVRWLRARAPSLDPARIDAEPIGKWCIYRSRDAIDDAWGRVK